MLPFRHLAGHPGRAFESLLAGASVRLALLLVSSSRRKVNHCNHPQWPARELSKGPFGLLLGPRRLLEQNQELGRAGGDACCTGGFDPAFTCVGTVLSNSARTAIQARLMRKARVRADSTRVRSTNDTSLRMPLKKETLLPCSVSQSTHCLEGFEWKPAGVWESVDKAHTLRLGPPFISFSVGLFTRVSFEYPFHRPLRPASFLLSRIKQPATYCVPQLGGRQ